MVIVANKGMFIYIHLFLFLFLFLFMTLISKKRKTRVREGHVILQRVREAWKFESRYPRASQK